MAVMLEGRYNPYYNSYLHAYISYRVPLTIIYRSKYLICLKEFDFFPLKWEVFADTAVCATPVSSSVSLLSQQYKFHYGYKPCI